MWSKCAGKFWQCCAVLFSVYLDELIVKLRPLDMASILVLFLWTYFYADAIRLLLCSCYGPQKLLDIGYVASIDVSRT